MASNNPDSPPSVPDNVDTKSFLGTPHSQHQNNLRTLPAQWVASYQDFVRQNSSQISSIETALRSLTYILPGRFHESPLTSETLYTALTLITAWHTHILSPITARGLRKRLSPAYRYERWCRAAGGRAYSRAAALLRTLQYTQLLCEMFAKRAGEKVRWRVIVILEFVKAVCRLIMMRATGNRPVIATSIGAENHERVDRGQETGREDTPYPENHVKEDDHADQLVNGHTIETPPLADPMKIEEAEYTTPRTGLRLPTRLPTPPSSSASSPSTESVHSYLSARTLTSDDIKSPLRLTRPLTTTRAQLAELLWILRPLIYALALQQYATTSSSLNHSNNRSWKRTWTPWLLGLGIELLSNHLSKQEIQSTVPGGVKGLSVVERDEYRRRRGAGTLGWWALRGALYENVTKGFVHGVAGKLKGKIVLDMLGVVVEDYEWLWGEWYFSTATA